ARHPGRARHHHPVLGAVVVHLQRQAGARADDDALDLEAMTVVDAVVITPGPMHLAMLVALGTPLGLEPGDGVLDQMELAAVGHQYHVGRFNHDRVLHADAGHHAAFGAHQHVVALHGEGVTFDHVAVGVLVANLPQRIPG